MSQKRKGGEGRESETKDQRERVREREREARTIDSVNVVRWPDTWGSRRQLLG